MTVCLEPVTTNLENCWYEVYRLLLQVGKLVWFEKVIIF